MKLANRIRAAVASLALVVLLVPATSHAASISWTSQSVIKSGYQAVLSTIQALTIRGSFIAQGQYVCDSNRNKNCGLMSGLWGLVIPEPSTYTATGGNVKVGTGPTATAKYEAVRTNNAWSSTASTRGLRTGSSVTLVAILDIITNNTGVSYDCVLKYQGVTGTGTAKILMFDNKTATGTYTYDTTFIKGATDIGSCGTLGTPKANSNVSLRFVSVETLVGK